MPDLVNDDGEPVAPSLTKDELDTLAEMGVEFDLSDDDSNTDAEGEDGEAVPDEDGDESVDDVPTDGESDEPADGDPKPDTDGEPDSEGDGSDADTTGSEADSDGESDGDTPADADPDADGEAEGEAEIDDSADADEGDVPDEVGGEMDDYEHTIEPDEDLVEEMDDRGDDEELAEKFDVDIEDVHRTDDRDIERWHQLVKDLQAYDTDLERRKRERDERIGDVRVDESAGEIEQRANQSGAISELKKGFRQLVSRPTPRPATAGPQIDPYNVTRRAAGDMTITELFEERVEVETGDRCVGLATDISGSMRGDMSELKIAGGVIAEATQIIGDDFVWEAFTDQYGHGHTPSEERLDLRIVTGPNEDFQWEHVDSFTSTYNEPTAAGVRDCRTLMERTAARQHVMIVITDGVTLVEEDGAYGGRSSSAPVDHARRAVEECRQDGFEVIGLGIGDMDEEKMEEQFGTDSQGNPNYKLTTIDDLAEDILEIYKAQMSVSR